MTRITPTSASITIRKSVPTSGNRRSRLQEVHHRKAATDILVLVSIGILHVAPTYRVWSLLTVDVNYGKNYLS
jgi:hypothetical protein